MRIATGGGWREALAAAAEGATVRGTEGLAPGGSIALGNFDGGHLGHRAIFEALRLVRPAVAVTFDRHPGHLLGDPPAPPPEVEPLEARLRRMEEWGLDVAVVLPLSRDLLGTEAEAFARTVVAALEPSRLVAGPGFRFGRGRAGDAGTFRRASEVAGRPLKVLEVPAVVVDGEPVSSTRLRRVLGAGDVASAARLLGRTFAHRGRVVAGAGRGRRLGAPTANVDPPPGAALLDGVYAVRLARVGAADPDEAAPRDGVANLGRRPTFGGTGRTLEVHLLEGRPPVAGEAVEVSFVERLRDEVRFETPEALADQIRRDAEAARRALLSSPSAGGAQVVR